MARLEVLLMEHERLLEHYSDLMLDQQSQIDTLKKRIRRLELRLEKDETVDEPGRHHQPPPHY